MYKNPFYDNNYGQTYYQWYYAPYGVWYGGDAATTAKQVHGAFSVFPVI